MKFVKLLIFGSLFLVFACEKVKEEISFEVPQPVKTRSLTGFPTKITGTYISQVDSSQLSVSSHLLIRNSDRFIRIHKDSLNGEDYLLADSTFDLFGYGEVNAKPVGDSVEYHFHNQDTIFDLARGDVLKKFRGYYFLNRNYGEHNWAVKCLVFRKGKLDLKEILTREDLEKLMAITQTQPESKTGFNPTQKQFKQFVKAGGFAETEQFIRLR